MKTHPFTNQELYNFITTASKNTYAAGGKPIKKPQRPGFIELTYKENDFSYRDSYTGFYRSRGMELVRYKSSPVWISAYGGGMVKGKEKLAKKTFEILKGAFLNRDKNFMSFRGPNIMNVGEWHYTYKQEGDVAEFSGHEEMKYRNKLVFFHRIIGGLIIHK